MSENITNEEEPQAAAGAEKQTEAGIVDKPGAVEADSETAAGAIEQDLPIDRESTGVIDQDISEAEAQSDSGKTRKRIALIVGIIVVIIVILLLLWQCSPRAELAPPQDTQAKSLEQPEEKMSAPEGGGSVNLTYSGQVSINTESGDISLYLVNPARSTHGISVELFAFQGDSAVSISESGLIPAGYELSDMQLSDSVEIQPGVYQGYLLVTYFDPDTKQAANTNTRINLDSITVN